jgi:hypothetical protein
MQRIVVSILALGAAACATTMGGPEEVGLSAVAYRVAAGTSPAAAAATLAGDAADVALVVAPGDSAWFAALAEAADLHLSGPARAGDLGLALLAMEPLGDTVIDVRYDGGSIPMVDALYDLADEHYLDLMAVRVQEGDAVQAVATRLLRYIATDVPPSAAIILAVAVPSPAVGDSLARLLSPGYFDALRCGGTDAPGAFAGEIRLFYGPEARLWCGDAEASRTGAGDRIHAELTAGLR